MEKKTKKKVVKKRMTPEEVAAKKGIHKKPPMDMTPKTRKPISAKQLAACRKNGAKGGRPAEEINWDEFEKLCQFHCTLAELSGWFRCSVDMIENAVKREFGIGFKEYSKQKRGAGKSSLRRAQWNKALGGENTMLIWMGKQHLGQSDKSKFDHDVSQKSVITFESNGRELEIDEPIE